MAVSLFFTNQRPKAATLVERDQHSAFQAELDLHCPQARRHDGDWDQLVNALQYRDAPEYGVGHNVGVEEVGCVHTCQGLEVDTIGVIIGPDLVFRDGQLQTNPIARARSDKSLTGWRAAMATDPKGTEERLSRLIRNTYRTLMSRGMKSCWVFACDLELQGYLLEKLDQPALALKSCF